MIASLKLWLARRRARAECERLCCQCADPRPVPFWGKEALVFSCGHCGRWFQSAYCESHIGRGVTARAARAAVRDE